MVLQETAVKGIILAMSYTRDMESLVLAVRSVPWRDWYDEGRLLLADACEEEGRLRQAEWLRQELDDVLYPDAPLPLRVGDQLSGVTGRCQFACECQWRIVRGKNNAVVIGSLDHRAVFHFSFVGIGLMQVADPDKELVFHINRTWRDLGAIEFVLRCEWWMTGREDRRRPYGSTIRVTPASMVRQRAKDVIKKFIDLPGVRKFSDEARPHSDWIHNNL